MKPRVESQVWRYLTHDGETRRWHVFFEDSCGCEEEEHFSSFQTALRFACHLASGGDRWQFVA